MPEPLIIEPKTHEPKPGNPPTKIIDNKPAKTLAQSIANAKAQAEAAK